MVFSDDFLHFLKIKKKNCRIHQNYFVALSFNLQFVTDRSPSCYRPACLCSWQSGFNTDNVGLLLVGIWSQIKQYSARVYNLKMTEIDRNRSAISLGTVANHLKLNRNLSTMRNQLGTFSVNGEWACSPFVTKSGHADNSATLYPV